MTTVQKLQALGLLAVLCLRAIDSHAEASNLTIPVKLNKMEKDSLQKNPAAFHLSTTLTSKHIWRAMPAGDAPCIEPLVTFSSGGLAVSAWASWAIDNSYKELDLFATYTWKNFQIGIFDYYCPSDAAASNEFFDFDKPSTRHLFEAQASWLGTEKLPLSVMAGCFIGGFDMDEKQNQLYSTYLELNYPLLRGKHNILLTLGGTPAKSMYANKAAIFNYGITYSSSIGITKKWSIPYNGHLVYNSIDKKFYFSLSISLQ